MILSPGTIAANVREFVELAKASKSTSVFDIRTTPNASSSRAAWPSRFGEITFLTEAEAKATSDMNDMHLDRPWEMWKRNALKKGA